MLDVDRVSSDNLDLLKFVVVDMSVISLLKWVSFVDTVLSDSKRGNMFANSVKKKMQNNFQPSIHLQKGSLMVKFFFHR